MNLAIKNPHYKRFLAYFIVSYFVLGGLVLAACNGIYGYRLAWNITDSVKGWVFLIDTTDKRIVKGELIAVHAPNTPFYDHDPSFIKYVYGVQGDLVQFDPQGNFSINGELKGRAKPYSSSGVKLEHSSGGIIGNGQFFLGTPHKDSFDSRYKIIGNLNEKAIIGRPIRLI